MYYDQENLDEFGNPTAVSAYINFKTAFDSYPAGTYIDYTDGVVFMPSASDPNMLYPIGNAATSDMLALIHKQFGNAVVNASGARPVLLAPEEYYKSIQTVSAAATVVNRPASVATTNSVGASSTDTQSAASTAPVIKTTTVARTAKKQG